jgi:hypothetical protein
MSDEYPKTIEYTKRAEDAGETVALAAETVALAGETVALGDATAPADFGTDATTYVRFGPGVPVPKTPAPDHATALWRGEVGAAEPGADPALTWRRRTQRWILPLTVLILVIAVLIYYPWGRGSGNPLGVEGASVQVSERSVGCGGTERLTAVIQTNGGAGTISYRWLRSDGTSSEQLSQPVTSGERQVSVALDWSFDGHGTIDANATISILSPQAEKATASFQYHCPA